MRASAKRSLVRFSSAILITGAALSVSRAMAQNIVQNGGFESGSGNNVPNWTLATSNISIDTTMPHTGMQDLYFNVAQPIGTAYAYQYTPVGSVTPGSTYTFSFFAEGTLANGGEGHYQIAFVSASGNYSYSGVQIFSPTSSYTMFPSAAHNTFVAPAGATQAFLQFYAVTGGDSGSTAQIRLDDVSFSTGTTTVTTGVVSVWSAPPPGGGDYNNPANWTNGVPNAVDAEADFFGDITSNQTITNTIAITLGTLNFNNANTYNLSGTGPLTLQASAGPATIIVQAGTQIVGYPLTIASNTNLNVSSGATLAIPGSVTVNTGETLASTGTGTVNYQSATITVNGGGTFTIGNSTYPHSLTLSGNGAANVSSTTSGSRKLIQLDILSLATGSTLNLANNDLVVHGDSLSSIAASVATGYNNGAWNGTGIQSTAAAADSAHLTALGVIANTNAQGNALYGTGTALGLFDGISPALGDILVKYTYYGDTNLDGMVDGSDYSNIDNGFANRLTGWANGDLNYDNVVDGSDYTLIDNAFNMQGSQIASAAAQLASSTAQIGGQVSTATAVPEPTLFGIASIAVTALVRRRGRQR